MVEATCPMADQELMDCAQAGDPQALNTLLSAVRPLVFRYCRSRLATYAGGLDAAEDVAQETCVALVKVLPHYQRQGSPFAAFVYAIASHKVADAQRRFGRAALLVEEFPDLIELSPNPEDRAMATASVQVAHELLDQLPPRMREVLLLRADGSSAEVVGLELGMSANAVRVTQHRGSARLRGMIEASEDHRAVFDFLPSTRQDRPAA